MIFTTTLVFKKPLKLAFALVTEQRGLERMTTPSGIGYTTDDPVPFDNLFQGRATHFIKAA